MEFINSSAFAKEMDEKDPLNKYRDQFYIPIVNGKPSLYFTGNSLGLQPKRTQDIVLNELEDWATHGVEGHFHARNPWFSYHELLTDKLAKIVGAKHNEVVSMNQLTVNLHLLFVSFYRPTAKKYKILTEAKAFPSDQYAVESQVRFHGYDPNDAIIEISPRAGQACIDHEDIYQAIEKYKDELALVFFGGVNYYTGQVFDMKRISAKAHEFGITAGFDLAHAAGNIKLELHDWEVDFASWCSYKYLNSGPGGVSGVYIHEKHATNTGLIRFAGWWGHDKETRFKMEKGFRPIPSAEGWQMSNAPVLSMAAHLASLELFDEVGMDALIAKSRKLTNYLEFILTELNSKSANPEIRTELITPKTEKDRGCQLSILVHGKGRDLFDALTRHGVIADWREPNVIRVAPVPMYNSFSDVYEFGALINHLLNH